MCAVIVVGGKVRLSALGDGTTRTCAVADAVRKHSRQPVLLIHDEHPLLEAFLPSIAEEPHCEAVPVHLVCALQNSAQASPAQPHQLPAARVPGVQAHVVTGRATSLKPLAHPRAGQAEGQLALTAC